jgi:large subunit ribosomal protein L7A
LKEELSDPKVRVVGRKQVLRALSRGEAVEVFLAKDGDSSIVRELREAAAKAGVPVRDVESKSALGRTCGIEVGASVAAVLKIEA